MPLARSSPMTCSTHSASVPSGRSDRSQMRVDSSFCSPTSRSMVLVLCRGWGAAGLGWPSLRGQPSVWQVPGRQDPWVFTGILVGLLVGLGIVFASRMAFFRFDWARALHRDFRALLMPLGDSEI